MAYWKLGVAVFIPNNGFRWGNRVGGLLTAAITTGTSLSYDNATVNGETPTPSDGLVKFVRSGDKILLGPSTATGYEGANEYVTITSVTSTTMSFRTQTTFQYADNDPITGIGTNTAGSWMPDDDTNQVMGGITRHSLHSLTTLDGVGTRYSQQFSNNETTTHHLTYNLNKDDFLPNIPFRTGCYYQYYGSPADSGQCQIQVRASGSAFITETITSTNVITWTEYNSAVAKTPSSHNDDWLIRPGITSVTSGTGYLNITAIYLEHAAGTSGESSGAYTFPEYCDSNSRKFKWLRGSSFYRTVNQTLKTNDFTGLKDGAKKAMISASFSDVSNTFRDYLEVLLDWQLRGKYLILHHDIPSAPPNIQGKLSIKDTSLKSWNSGLCSFSLDFEEA